MVDLAKPALHALGFTRRYGASCGGDGAASSLRVGRGVGVTPSNGLPKWDGALDAQERSLIRHTLTGQRLDLEGGATPTDDQTPIELQTMRAWGADRTIRAEVLRHLLVSPQWPAHSKGVRLRGARIIGPLDLESAVLRCPLALEDCYFDSEQPVALDYAAASLLRLLRCRLRGLTADRLVVTMEMDLGRSTVTGMIRMLGAEITAQLNLVGVTITGTDESGTAMMADGIKVGGAILLHEFTAAGAVSFVGADLDALICSGARMTGADTQRRALVADGLKVGREVYLNQFTAAGAVWLVRADISGDFVCGGAKITGRSMDGNALVANGVKFGGSVFLDEGFKAAGAVRLTGAEISGHLICSSAKIGRDKEGTALAAGAIKVGASVLLDEGFTAAGAVSLVGAHVAGHLSLRNAMLADPVALVANGARVGQQLVWAPRKLVTGWVHLERTHVYQLQDDWSKEGGYWPVAGLRIAGFIYQGFGGENQATCEQRLDWIRSQHQSGMPSHFDAQPYEQLVRVYRETGYESDARRVAIARHSDLREYGGLSRRRCIGNWLLDVTIKHGYQPMRALGMLLAVFVAAFLLSLVAQHQDALIVPAKDTRSLGQTPRAADSTQKYPTFYPLGYAIDLSFPIIKIGQAENWRPNGAAPWGWAFVGSTWVITGLGWAFTTLAVVGYTGLIRRD